MFRLTYGGMGDAQRLSRQRSCVDCGTWHALAGCCDEQAIGRKRRAGRLRNREGNFFYKSPPGL